MRMQFFPVFLVVGAVVSRLLIDAPGAEESRVAKAETKPAVHVEEKSSATPTSVAGGQPQLDQRSSQDMKEWWLTALVDGYRHSGKTNAAWDQIAISAFEDASELNLHQDVDEVASGLMQQIFEKAKKASELGCDDAYISYFKLRYGKGREPDKYFSELFYGYVASAEAMDKTEYHPLLKTYANFHACESTLNANPPLPKTAERAKALLRYATQALADAKIPPKDATTAADCAVWIGRKIPGGTSEVEAKVFPILQNNWRNNAFSYIAQGHYFIDLAWEARGGSYADQVTREGWKGFEENIKKADAILRKGWEIDRSNIKLPIAMITVCTAQSAARPEMEKWFERAMKLDPNSYGAVMAKANYLEPKWLGTPEEFLSFGRECVETKSWGGKIPLTLVWVHYQLRIYSGLDPEKYFSNKIVWRDLRASYERFFEMNPKDVLHRHEYARDAYKCGQYKAFLDQLGMLGSETNNYRFADQEKFKEMVRKAAAATSI